MGLQIKFLKIRWPLEGQSRVMTTRRNYLKGLLYLIFNYTFFINLKIREKKKRLSMKRGVLPKLQV